MEHPILQEAKGHLPYMLDIFYQLHRNPELSHEEFQTQKLILAELEKMGIEAKPIAETGVVGIIRGGKPGKTVAFRADMDALPIQEETGLPYASQVPNVMHACGHEAHMAVLLGAAKMFVARKESIKGNIKLFFQPAEEKRGGAARMIAAGCMEDPHVDAAFFGHVTASVPTGTISLRPGATNAASNSFTVTFRGKGAHGAAPHKGADPIVAACQAVLALQTISSRRTNPVDSVALTVGSFQAGTASNIIPETAVIMGTLRTIHPETRERAKKDFVQIVEGIAAAMGVEAEINLRDGYAAVINDEAMTSLVQNAAEALLGEGAVNILKAPSMGAEDFGYFMQASTGCKYHLGMRNEEKGCTSPAHNGHFAVDTDALPVGAALFVKIAEDFLG